jgi:methylglutaconyl-CoA hydratase
MRTLDRLPKPTVAVVQGSAFGGGVGLVAACDMAIAAEEAQFSLTEVRLGLIPSIIGPYVVAAIGVRQARRYVLSAERFSAAEARRIGLVHEVVPGAELAAAADRLLDAVAANGPASMAAAKNLIADLAARPIDEGTAEMTARRIAEIRASDEAREGLAAFLEKRKPIWPTG